MLIVALQKLKLKFQKKLATQGVCLQYLRIICGLKKTPFLFQLGHPSARWAARTYASQVGSPHMSLLINNVLYCYGIAFMIFLVIVLFF